MIELTSFAYKAGGPPDACDRAFDCRRLPNPHYVAELKVLTGLDEPVQAYLKDYAGFEQLQLLGFSELDNRGMRGHLAYGCYGGRHRSVATVEALAARLKALGLTVRVRHLALNVDKEVRP